MKRCVPLIYGLLILVLLLGSQPTSEEEIIVNKAEGQLQQIIESTAASTDEIGVEERWETNLQQEKYLLI